jgi:hypothetical protein
MQTKMASILFLRRFAFRETNGYGDCFGMLSCDSCKIGSFSERVIEPLSQPGRCIYTDFHVSRSITASADELV